MTILAIGISVCVVREVDAKLVDNIDGLCGGEKSFTQTRKHVKRSVNRCRFHMTVGTDLRNGSLAGEELSPGAVQARGGFGKLGDIRKRCVAFANFFPVLRRKLVTRRTRELLFSNMS